jgi:hypothetical protein
MAVMARDMWTDQRLDDLNARVESMDRRMEAGFAEMREEFRAVRAEAASMYRTLIQVMVGGFVVMGTGFAGTIATVILTHA